METSENLGGFRGITSSDVFQLGGSINRIDLLTFFNTSTFRAMGRHDSPHLHDGIIAAKSSNFAQVLKSGPQIIKGHQHLPVALGVKIAFTPVDLAKILLRRME
jgi:hypothetical protein